MMITHNDKETRFEPSMQYAIDAALQGHLTQLHDALFHFLSALLMLLLFVVSLSHAIVQAIYGLVGLCLWVLGVWKVGLTELKRIVDSQISSNKEVDDDEEHDIF